MNPDLIKTAKPRGGDEFKESEAIPGDRITAGMLANDERHGISDSSVGFYNPTYHSCTRRVEGR